MNKFSFQIKVEGAPQIATLRFAAQNELRRYHGSLLGFSRRPSTLIREAVEFTYTATVLLAAARPNGLALSSDHPISRRVSMSPLSLARLIAAAAPAVNHFDANP